MKRLIFISTLSVLMLASCEIIPEASFYTDTVDPVVGEPVYFTNESYNSDRFEWDFGDGTFSEAANPVHTYKSTGTFQVQLKAYSRSGLSDETYLTLTVLIPTLLEIEVLEYYDEYPVENAIVILYPTLSDWDAERNSVSEGSTDMNGKVVFSDPGNFVFYVDAWEEHHNNYGLRDEDVNFIRTEQVKPNQINRFVAYVDYVAGTKSGDKRSNKPVVKSIIRKAENVSDTGGTEGWEELAARSIKVNKQQGF
jgi:PKD repeat protein